jgi:YD repeat-containing protein
LESFPSSILFPVVLANFFKIRSLKAIRLLKCRFHSPCRRLARDSLDALHRLATEQEPFGLVLTFSYDAVGNRTLVQDSFGGVTTSVYGAANRLTSREFGGVSQTPLRSDFTYTARDQVATVTRYKNLAGTQVAGTGRLPWSILLLLFLSSAVGQLSQEAEPWGLSGPVTRTQRG